MKNLDLTLYIINEQEVIPWSRIANEIEGELVLGPVLEERGGNRQKANQYLSKMINLTRGSIISLG
jgi:hypothetical protein